MKNLLCLLALCAFPSLIGCKSSHTLARGETVHDTIERTATVVVRDTVIITPSATALVSVPVKTLLNNEKTVFKSQDKQATVILTSNEGRVQAKCECDTLAITATIRDQYERERRITAVMKPSPAEPEPIPWYTEMLAWFGGIVLAASLIALLAKRFLPPKLS